MVLFDYGGTLARETAPDFLRGWRAVFRYVGKNPEGATPEQTHQLADSLWLRFSGLRCPAGSRPGGAEMHEWHQLQTVFDALAIEPARPLGEMERVLMEHACPCEPAPLAAELLALLDRQGIPTGVVSNIGWSGQALAGRLEELFPEHRFAFVLASSEYGIRKPDPLLFQIALQKARVPAKKVWFCGDSLEADMEGAQGAGMFPVWFRPGEGAAPAFPCLAVEGWGELAALLEGLPPAGEVGG